MTTQPYSVDDDLAALTPRRRFERSAGVIDGEATRWTDDLWTYPVLVADGRRLKRVRESVPTSYQSGAGLRRRGDRVVVQRMSRTLWEIVADQTTTTSWSDPDYPGPIVDFQTHARLPAGGDETERVEAGRFVLQADGGVGTLLARATSRYGDASAPEITSAGIHAITAAQPDVAFIRLFVGQTLEAFGADDTYVELVGYGAVSNHGITLKTTSPGGEAQTIRMSDAGVSVESSADADSAELALTPTTVTLEFADGVRRYALVSGEADGLWTEASPNGPPGIRVRLYARGQYTLSSTGSASGGAHGHGRGSTGTHSHAVNVSGTIRGADIVGIIQAWLEHPDMPVDTAVDVEIHSARLEPTP